MGSLLPINSNVFAAVLPEERIDAMAHSYEGGGLEVNGPALLVRKGVTTGSSVFYNVYEDNITSASIDVEIGGSQYEEARTEQTVGIDFLRGKTTMNISYTDSAENDYEAQTISFGLTQDFFGDLSTLSMGYSQGTDLVKQRVNTGPDSFIAEDRAEINRQNFRLGLTQVLTKNSTISMNWETITDEATSLSPLGVTLNNPYRSYSFNNSGSRDYRPEKYPSTRTSNAVGIRGSYFLDFNKSAIHYEYRYFDDDWGINASTIELGYVFPIRDWIMELRYRLYSQDQADFYSDLFDSVDQFTFMARDKELSTFSSTSYGLTVSYEFAKGGWGWIDKGSLNLSYDFINFEYDNFRDARENLSAGGSLTAGAEPLYTFEADVFKAYLSIWY